MSEIRVNNIIADNGLDAVNFAKGINVSSGIITATSFSGSGANLTALPAANITGTLPAISGANLTGTGITQADQWRITSGFNASSSAYITSNWERVDTDGFGQIGTGMSQSSGEFTFPSTGIYLIDFRSRGLSSSVSTYVGIKIYTTLNNSSYDEASNSYDSVASNGKYFAVGCQHIFDVTSTSTHKVKFQAESEATASFHGNSDRTDTGVSFLRLGDT